VRVEHITSIDGDKKYVLDSQFPGTFTAADLFVHDHCIATIVGLHLRYRKDKSGKFIGDPEDDLDALKKDFEHLHKDRQKPLIVAGDFNYDMDQMPWAFKKLGRGDLALVDTFEHQPRGTFEQDWGERHWFRLDYMFLSKTLNNQVTFRQGGNPEFPTALEMSDHSPLLIEVDISDFL
jgi:endonuclease/exonuclease/phosphatase (EEP) superfamily protein YafD